MTKEEVLAKLKELGIDVNGATDEVIQKAQAWLEDQKAQLDTETRRKVRAAWIAVSFWFVLHDMPLFQSVTLCAYACGEFGSIVENIERAGFGDALPPVLKKLFLSLEKRLENAVDSKLDQIGLDDEEKDKKTK